MEFHPAVFPVNNISPRRGNSLADKVMGKNGLPEAITHAFGDRVLLGNRFAANGLQNKIPVLPVHISLIQESLVFRVQVKLDVPITILLGSRFHNDSRDGKIRIDDLQAVFGARESAVIDVRPEGYIARRPLDMFEWSYRARREIAASYNAEQSRNK